MALGEIKDLFTENGTSTQSESQSLFPSKLGAKKSINADR